MSVELRIRHVRIWLTDANQDLRAAKHMVGAKPQYEPRHAGFLAAQAAEKALKGAGTFAGLENPGPTHNVAALIAALPEAGWQTKQSYKDVAHLTRMAANTRYLINESPVSWDDVEKAIRLAEGIMTSCRRDLKANGFPLDALPLEGDHAH
jgi:HEPN domain-containing protein